ATRAGACPQVDTSEGVLHPCPWAAHPCSEAALCGCLYGQGHPFAGASTSEHNPAVGSPIGGELPTCTGSLYP
ncbi:unnamed protein product, partial [Musa textilis]